MTVEENVPPVIPVTSVTLNKNEMSPSGGRERDAHATVLPHNATDKSLTWTSSNPTAATVNQAGGDRADDWHDHHPSTRGTAATSTMSAS